MKMTEAQYLQDIGTKIRYYREKLNITQLELGEKSLGAHQHVSVSHIEHGKKNCTILTLKRIAEVLGVPVQDILP